MVCFLAALVPGVGWTPFHPSQLSLLLVIVQPLVWSLTPLALWMASESLSSGFVKRWARACVAISLVAWLTYDVAGLHRLVSLRDSATVMTVMKIPIPSIVPFGWWSRNLELMTTALLMPRLAAGHHAEVGTRLRWLNGLVAFVCIAVATQCAALLVFQYKFIGGVLPADRSLVVLLSAGSVLMHVTQSIATVAVGVLLARPKGFAAPTRAISV
jgi:hypothetical protein